MIEFRYEINKYIFFINFFHRNFDFKLFIFVLQMRKKINYKIIVCKYITKKRYIYGKEKKKKPCYIFKKLFTYL